MTNMNTADFLNAVDRAAGMNDRWLFLAAFCLLLLVCGAVIRWLVQQLQGLIADHKALRDEHHAALAQIIASQNETSLKLAVCIDRNTEALRECAFELRRFQERKEI
jgi:predicted PurR-regulated permease PerM